MFTNINPKILVWARKESGYKTPVEVAEKLKIETQLLRNWETDGKNVDFSALELIAKIYKRQTAVFFLPKVPESVKKPRDHRNLKVDMSSFSPETFLAFRRTERYLKTARELNGDKPWSKRYDWLKQFTGNENSINEECELLRKLLDVPIKTQIKQSDPDVAFRFWREEIEDKLSIFVFQFPFPSDEMDGFSYTLDNFPYAIVVNSSNRQSVRKIFTLFHELCHIFKRESEICITNPDDRISEMKSEFDCNDFAGKFLIPDEVLENHNSSDEIYESAKILKVSSEAYLRRMRQKYSLSDNLYYSLLMEVKRKASKILEMKKRESKKRKIFLSGVVRSKSSRGKKFYSLVTDAAHSGRITYSTASDLLSLKIGSIGA